MLSARWFRLDYTQPPREVVKLMLQYKSWCTGSNTSRERNAACTVCNAHPLARRFPPISPLFLRCWHPTSTQHTTRYTRKNPPKHSHYGQQPTTPSNMAPKLTLTYFDSQGFAEGIRWALELSGLEWEDKRLTGEEFAVLKPSEYYVSFFPYCFHNQARGPTPL